MSRVLVSVAPHDHVRAVGSFDNLDSFDACVPGHLSRTIESSLEEGSDLVQLSAINRESALDPVGDPVNVFARCAAVERWCFLSV
jgi:hypothetical protein